MPDLMGLRGLADLQDEADQSFTMPAGTGYVFDQDLKVGKIAGGTLGVSFCLGFGGISGSVHPVAKGINELAGSAGSIGFEIIDQMHHDMGGSIGYAIDLKKLNQNLNRKMQNLQKR